jgi:hypothetical protein
LEVVDEDTLPSFLGGKCNCDAYGGDCFKSDRGPWNQYKIIAPKTVVLKEEFQIDETDEYSIGDSI